MFNIDFGHIRYYGDNKVPGKNPSKPTGNKHLEFEFANHHKSASKSTRLKASPLLFFRSATYKGKSKGYVEFMGFGIVEKIEIITQYAQKEKHYFSNFLFDFAVFDLSSESELFDWQWIIDRSNKSLSDKDALKHAPKIMERMGNEGQRCLKQMPKKRNSPSSRSSR